MIINTMKPPMKLPLGIALKRSNQSGMLRKKY
jgi:hypothetical protein